MGKINKKILAEKTHENLSGKLPADILKRKVRRTKPNAQGKKSRKSSGNAPIKKKVVQEAPGIPLPKSNVMSNTKLFPPPPPALLRKNHVADNHPDEDLNNILSHDIATIKEFYSPKMNERQVEQDAGTVLDGKVPLPEESDNLQHNSDLISENPDSFSEDTPEHDYIEPIDLIHLTDDFIEQVDNLLEISNYLSVSSWMPKDVVDMIHALVRSLNLDVMSLYLPSLDYGEPDNLFHRGYKMQPTRSVIKVWSTLFDKDTGINWSDLMDMAQSVNTEVAYWIVLSNLHSIGYVPIKTGGIIYGFIFVASIGKKKPSPLTASLLDLCGSRIALEYKMKFILSH